MAEGEEDSKCTKIVCAVVLLVWSIPFLGTSTTTLGIFLSNWAHCSIKYYGICYSILFRYTGEASDGTIPDIILKDTDNEAIMLNSNETKKHLQEFEDFSKTVMLFSILAVTLSHLFFIIALIRYCCYTCDWKIVCCCDTPDDDDSNITYNKVIVKKNGNEVRQLDNLVNPNITLTVDNVNNNYIINIVNSGRASTPASASSRNLKFEEYRRSITCRRVIHWILAIGVSIILLGCLVGLYFGGQHHPTYKLYPSEQASTFKDHELAAGILYFVSLFSTLVICYCFSAHMYTVQTKCEEHLEITYKSTSIELTQLKKKDKEFVKKAVNELGFFQLWFLIHWLFYIISSFLSLSLLLEVIVLRVKAVLPHLESGAEFSLIQVFFLFFFAAIHIFLLLYPCLRAASVTRTRKRVIKKIFMSSNVPDGIKKEYVDFMEKQNFGFRLRILCASIPFNLNVAYISFAAGILGIVVSLIFAL